METRGRIVSCSSKEREKKRQALSEKIAWSVLDHTLPGIYLACLVNLQTWWNIGFNGLNKRSTKRPESLNEEFKNM